MARVDFDSRDGLEVAAESGQGDALFELGLMYCSGRDGRIDLVQAHKWFNLAAMRGIEEAKQYRFEIARDMTKADVAQAQKLAREWMRQLH